MWNQITHVIAAMAILFFATISLSSVASKLLYGFEASLRRWLSAPMAFFILFLSVVLIRLSQPLTRVPLAQWLLLICAATGFVKFLKRGHSQIFDFFNSIAHVILPYVGFSIAALAVRGGLPFSVSDSWTHTSYINRISATNSALIAGSHLPGDGNYFSFSPTSIFLSTVSDVSGNDPIATWNGACIFLGVMLISAQTAFVLALRLITVHQRSHLGFMSLLFVCLFPVADMVRGWAGYSMTGSVFLFVSLTLLVQCSADQSNKLFTNTLLISGFIIGVNHQVESIIGLLMAVPLFVLPHVSKKRLAVLIASYGLVSAIGGFVAAKILNPEILGVLDFSLSWSVYRYLISSIKKFSDFKLMIAAMVSLVYLWATGRRLLVRYFSACVAAFLLLGPVNPLLFPIWARLVSVTLMYRAIFAVPVWILFGYFFAICAKDIVGDRMTKNRILALQVLALTGTLLPLGMYAGEKFGLTGNETYYGKDSQSQLNSLPHLYRTIQELDQKVVLTDIWTGAPIPTISKNYIVVHRPWTSGPEKNRWTDGMETMRSLTSSHAHQNLCKWQVDLVLLNRAELPLMESQFLASPWLLPDFYNATNGPLPTYLREVDVIDNVQILNFDKKTCSE